MFPQEERKGYLPITRILQDALSMCTYTTHSPLSASLINSFLQAKGNHSG